MITLTMASDVANRYFQGKENVMMAVFSGRVKIAGPMAKIMELAPVTTPVNAVYRAWLTTHDYAHLVA
jgi:putative sterol carrier protein